MYLQRNTEARSGNIVAVEKQKILQIYVCACVRVGVDARTQAQACVCAQVVLRFQCATRMRRIFYGPCGSTIFFDIFS
jgi:hypothetical protein